MKKPAQGILALAVIGTVVVGAACLGGPASEASGQEGKAAAGDVVGRVGDRTFTLAEVDRAAMKANIQAFQQVYDARRQALDGLIEEALLEGAAADKGVTVEQLVESEIVAKTAAVTDEAIQGFYEQNKARMGGRTLEQIGPQIREYLTALNANQARADYVDGLRAAANVDIRLDPPRVEMEIAENDPSKGPATAKVTIVEYSDFQ